MFHNLFGTNDRCSMATWLTTQQLKKTQRIRDFFESRPAVNSSAYTLIDYKQKLKCSVVIGDKPFVLNTVFQHLENS